MTKATEHRTRYKTSTGKGRLLKRNKKGQITDNQSEKLSKQRELRKQHCANDAPKKKKECYCE